MSSSHGSIVDSLILCFVACFMMFEFAEVRKYRCHRVGVENLCSVLRLAPHEELLRAVVPSPTSQLKESWGGLSCGGVRRQGWVRPPTFIWSG
jgi:hypothetical protein